MSLYVPGPVLEVEAKAVNKGRPFSHETNTRNVPES